MESLAAALFVNSIIGVLLLLFGLKFMKLAVALMGFVLGFSLTSPAIATLAWPEWLAMAVPILVGLVLAVFAFTIYKIAVTTSIALFFASLTHQLVLSAGQGDTTAWTIAILVGLAAFVVVWVLKLVDVFFAIATSAQGASLLVMVAYGIVFSLPVALLQGYEYSAVGHYEWAWILGWLVLTIIGSVAQLSSKSRHSSSLPSQTQ